MMAEPDLSLSAAVRALQPLEGASNDYVALFTSCLTLATELDAATGRGTAATARELRIALAQLTALRQDAAASERADYISELRRRAAQRTAAAAGDVA